MAAGTCRSKTLASCEVATGEHHAKTVDKKPTEVKKLKKVNEAMVTRDATIKNRMMRLQ